MRWHGISVDIAQVLFGLAAVLTAWKGLAGAKKGSQKRKEKNAEEPE